MIRAANAIAGKKAAIAGFEPPQSATWSLTVGFADREFDPPGSVAVGAGSELMQIKPGEPAEAETESGRL